MKAMSNNVASAILKGSAVLALVVAASAHAALITLPQSSLRSSQGVYTPGGYYTTTLGPNIVTTGGGNGANIGAANGRNDDGFMSLNLGFNFTFFGTTHSSLFINNNGNVSFGSGLSAFVPTGPLGATSPVISLFFSDVDTRNASSGVVHYNLSADQLVVTWDDVGRYGSRPVPPSNSFQLVLRSDGYVLPSGEGQIGFFYETMDWEVSDTSTTGAVGFGNAVAGEGIVIAGSNTPGMNNVVENRYVWFNANLTPTCGVPGAPDCPTVPEPGSFALVALAGSSLLLMRRRKR